MRPLPRLHAITNGDVLALGDFRVRVAAVMSTGSAVAVHARDRQATDRNLARTAERIVAHARPAEATVFVNSRPDIAAATGAQGVQLGPADMSPAAAREVFPGGWIGSSVHTEDEARRAADEGADFLLAGSIFPTDTHPGQEPAGLKLIERTATMGLPVIAIGGINPERTAAVRDAGAWGVAAISAVWYAPDSGKAAVDLLEPWLDDDD